MNQRPNSFVVFYSPFHQVLQCHLADELSPSLQFNIFFSSIFENVFLLAFSVTLAISFYSVVYKRYTFIL